MCFVLFRGGVILTVLQEAMETRFSSSYFSIFCFCCYFLSLCSYTASSITSYFSPFSPALLVSLFSMVLLVGCMFSEGLVIHLFIVGPSSSTPTPSSSSFWTKGSPFLWCIFWVYPSLTQGSSTTMIMSRWFWCVFFPPSNNHFPVLFFSWYFGFHLFHSFSPFLSSFPWSHPSLLIVSPLLGFLLVPLSCLLLLPLSDGRCKHHG